MGACRRSRRALVEEEEEAPAWAAVAKGRAGPGIHKDRAGSVEKERGWERGECLTVFQPCSWSRAV